jgi:PAS domain S-box-containing protein
MKHFEELKRQAKEIDELSADLEMIFNNTQEAMFLVSVEDGEFRYIRFNKTYERYAGIDLKQTKGKTPVEVLGKEVGELVLADYRRCVQKREKITYERTQMTAAGPKTWMTSLTPVITDGVVKYIIGSRMDITELKKTKDENERLLHWLQTMFNEHSAIMLMIEPESGSILDANPSACAYYGYSKDELLSMNNADINIILQESETTEDIKPEQKNERYLIFKKPLKERRNPPCGRIHLSGHICGMTQHFAIIFDPPTERGTRNSCAMKKTF